MDSNGYYMTLALNHATRRKKRFAWPSPESTSGGLAGARVLKGAAFYLCADFAMYKKKRLRYFFIHSF